jgi:hypothetical protein
MSGINWTTIENAVAAWVRGGSGLASARVRWAEQNAERPEGAGAWISMNLPGLRRIGHDWADTEASPEPVTPGAEITYKVRGQRELVLTLQCFNGAGSGVSRAVALLDDVIAKLASPAQRRAFRTAGIGVGAVEPVRPMSGVVGSTRWEPRASVQLTLYVARETSETGPDLVSITGTGFVPDEADPDVTIELDIDAS